MKTIKIQESLTRSAVLSDESIGDKPTKRVSISSDIPYLRTSWDGEQYYEVLSHKPGGMDDSRLKLGLSVLFNHKRDDIIGRSTTYTNNGKRVEVGTLNDIKWSESAFAKEKKKDVESGVLVGTSVGYSLLDDGKQIGEIDGIPVIEFRWQPHEFSFCTIEADTSVGIGREATKPDGEQLRTISVTSTKAVDNPPNLKQSNNHTH